VVLQLEALAGTRSGLEACVSASSTNENPCLAGLSSPPTFSFHIARQCTVTGPLCLLSGMPLLMASAPPRCTTLHVRQSLSSALKSLSSVEGCCPRRSSSSSCYARVALLHGMARQSSPAKSWFTFQPHLTFRHRGDKSRKRLQNMLRRHASLLRNRRICYQSLTCE
jgi:hypothetical protein